MGQSLGKWIQRLQKGDQTAFLPLYEKTAPGLMRFLLWKTNGDRPLSEDILQESFVRFLVSLDRLECTEEFAVRGYLLQIVKHCLIDKAGRGMHNTAPHIPLEGLAEMAAPGEKTRQESAVELRELAIAMKSLDEKDSEIIWLRDGLGLSHKEVAGQIGITEQASRQAYVRAKRTLIAGLKHLVPDFGVGGAYAAELS